MPPALTIPTPADLLSKQGLALIVYFSLCAALLALLWLVHRRALNRLPDPVCAVCGYIAANLPGTVCPECGSNLAAGGTVPPGWLRSTEVLTHVVQWTIILPIVAFAITPMTWSFVRLREASQSVWLNSSLEPCSALISARGRGYRSPLRADAMDVEMQRPAGTSRYTVKFTVNPRTMTYVATSAPPTFKGPRSGRLDQTAMLALMSPGPNDPNAEIVRDEAAALLKQIQAAAAQVRWEPKPRHFDVPYRHGTEERDTPHDPLFLNIAAGFWALVWAVGVFIILRRRRRWPDDAAFRPVPETVLARWRYARQREREPS